MFVNRFVRRDYSVADSTAYFTVHFSEVYNLFDTCFYFACFYFGISAAQHCIYMVEKRLMTTTHVLPMSLKEFSRKKKQCVEHIQNQFAKI